MIISLDAAGIRVKVDHDLSGIGISHEESICTNWRDKGRLYGSRTGTMICVCAWAQ